MAEIIVLFLQGSHPATLPSLDSWWQRQWWWACCCCWRGWGCCWWRGRGWENTYMDGCIDESQRIPNTQSVRKTFCILSSILALIVFVHILRPLVALKGEGGEEYGLSQHLYIHTWIVEANIGQVGCGLSQHYMTPPFTTYCGQYWTGWAAGAAGGVDCLTLWRRQSAQTQQVLAEIALRSIHEFGNGVSANWCLVIWHRPQCKNCL